MSLRPRGLLLGVVVLMVAGVAIALVLLRHDGTGPDAGPLQTVANSEAVTVTGFQVPRGETGAIGVTVLLDPPPPEGLVLDGLGLIDPTPNLRVAGAMVSTGKGASYSCTGTASHFPPAGCRLFPLRGWAISAEARDHRGFQAVLGLSPTSTTASFAGVALSYHDSEGQHYVAVLPQAARVCVPASEPGCGPGLGQLRRDALTIAQEAEDGTFDPARHGMLWLAE
jgi:hypothetical protein